MSKKEYPEICPMELDEVGGYYAKHVSAMTAEELHSKSDIAIQLGWRDMQIDRLQELLDKREKQILENGDILEI